MELLNEFNTLNNKMYDWIISLYESENTSNNYTSNNYTSNNYTSNNYNNKILTDTYYSPINLSSKREPLTKSKIISLLDPSSQELLDEESHHEESSDEESYHEESSDEESYHEESLDEEPFSETSSEILVENISHCYIQDEFILLSNK